MKFSPFDLQVFCSQTFNASSLENILQPPAGVELLSAGLKSSHCKLEILRLSGCMVREEGCSSLASALSPNPSYLKELDLSYNLLGEKGVKLLSARQEDPHCSLRTLRVEHDGEMRIRPKKCVSVYFTLNGPPYTLTDIQTHTH
ncbi:hypothetical protein MHYP_G00090800 [Metynnis hypsauchen]